MDPAAFVLGCSAIGAGFAVMTGFGCGLGQGYVFGKSAEAIGRQPEARGAVMSTALVGAAIQEVTAIYGLVIAMILLFANPLMSLLH